MIRQSNRNAEQELVLLEQRPAHVLVQRVREVSLILRRARALSHVPSSLAVRWTRTNNPMNHASEYWYIGSMLARSRMAKEQHRVVRAAGFVPLSRARRSRAASRPRLSASRDLVPRPPSPRIRPRSRSRLLRCSPRTRTACEGFGPRSPLAVACSPRTHDELVSLRLEVRPLFRDDDAREAGRTRPSGVIMKVQTASPSPRSPGR